MAKIRIYELAREVNMTNKVLLEKIKALDIPIKSHMASLDKKTADKIKAYILDRKPDEIKVTRVKSTVIRRRKRPEEKLPAELIVIEPEIFKEEPLAVVPEEKESPDEVIPKDDEKLGEEKIEITKPATQEEIEAIQEDKKPETPITVDDSATVMRPAKKIKPPVKKSYKDKPAKIIKLAPPPIEKKPEQKKPEVKKPIVTSLKTVKKETKNVEAKNRVEAVALKTKKKQGKDETVSSSKVTKWNKKKTGLKRKEVVEGKDLYNKTKRKRKSHKHGKGKPAATGRKPLITTPKAIKRRIKIDETITLAGLAKRMGIKANQIIAKLMGMGVIATINQTIDYDTAVLVATDFDYEIENVSFEEETLLKLEEDTPENLQARPPVVTIMGHVDHGKTSLLDMIRKTKVTSLETGGITQHIGAYHVTTDGGNIVFLDTPGHEAFTAMRSRGASITDIIILVVAADDGVMPQTIEAINHAKAAQAPIIVAINKIDKPDADPDRVKRELAEIGLVPEDWGGDTIFVKVSAKKNIGIEDMLEMVILQAEVLELKANPDKLASGYVVEAKLDPGKGPVATVLVQQGTIHLADPVVCGIHYGKVRSLLNDRGVNLKSAGPSIPVEITGLTGVPNPGDELVALSDEKNAKQVSIHRIEKQRASDLAKTSRLSLERLYEKMKEGEVTNLNLIIKADVHGSVEAIRDSVIKLSNTEVKINVIHASAGTITESDISLASVSNAIIIGFNVRPNLKVIALANEEHVDMRFYNIIYNVIKDIKSAISGLMAATFKEHITGTAEIREVFHVPKIGAIAGCYVTSGKIVRNQSVRLIRDGIIIYEGKIGSLRRFKDDVKEVQNGYECGIGIENYNDIKIKDTIECFYMEEIKTELE